MLKKQVTILILTIIVAFVLCGVVSAATYTVGPNPTDDYATINGAITSGTVVDSDIIQVNPNTGGNPYVENVDITKNIVLTANGQVTIQTPNPNNHVIEVSSGVNGPTIEGFTITGATGDQCFGIYILNSNNCKILKNTITNCNYGIMVGTGTNNEISENTITTTASPLNGYSDGIDQGSSGIISKNIITVNAAGTGGAMGISPLGSNQITDNAINLVHTGSGYAIGILTSYSNCIVSGNTISFNLPGANNGVGISNYHNTINNRFSGNTITSNNVNIRGIQVNEQCSGIEITGNNIQTVGQGLYLYASTVTAQFNRIISTVEAIHVGTGGTVDARYNWYGSNADPSAKIIAEPQATITYNPWLRMVVSASETLIYTGGTSIITVDFTHDSTYDPSNPFASYHNPTLGHFPDGLSVLFQSTGGSISAGLPTSNGLATAIFTADSGPGLGLASGSRDTELQSANINILDLTSSNGQSNSQGNTSNNPVNAATSASTNTVGMQSTGAPIGMLVISVLLMLAGLIIPLRK